MSHPPMQQSAPAEANCSACEGNNGIGLNRLQDFKLSRTYTVGVELELVFPSSVTANEVQARLNTFGWMVKHDGSISCSPGAPSCFTLEVVSPVMHDERDIAGIYDALQAIKELRPSVNTTTGMHIHVGRADNSWTLDQLRNLAYNWVGLEKAFDMIVPSSRRSNKNRYCRSLLPRDGSRRAVQLYRKQIAEAPDVATLKDLVNPTDRYYKLNLRALERHNTVEFRHPGGTQNAAKVVGYLLTYRKLVELSESTKFRTVAKRYVYDKLCAVMANNLVILNWLRRRRQDFVSRGRRPNGSHNAPGSAARQQQRAPNAPGTSGACSHSTGCSCDSCANA